MHPMHILVHHRVHRAHWLKSADLVYGQPALSKARLLPREQWVDVLVEMSVDDYLEDFEEDTQQRYGAVTLWVPQWLFSLRDHNY